MGKKARPGVDDLKTLYPSIASEADGWDPSLFLPSSNKRLAWKCQTHGHPWIATPNDRVGSEKRKGTNCPYCANRRVWKGFNDLKSKFPKVAAEADGWDPEEIVFGSSKKLPWKCEKYGHSWSALVVNRTKDKDPTGCPYCANQKLLVGFNDLTTRHPSIAAEADGWDPSKVLAGTNKKMKWRCKKHGHPFKQEINNRIRLNSGCPYCANKKVLPGFNDLKTLFPEIAEEAWGWDPSQALAGSGDKKDWRCRDYSHPWDTTIVSRTGKNKSNCPVCANQKVQSGFNDLATRFPDIAKQASGWEPAHILPGTHAKKRWQCPDHSDHFWEASVYSRTSGDNGCPICSNRLLLPGFNDLATKFPLIANEAYLWDPSEYLYCSSVRMPWQCQAHADHIWETTISARVNNLSRCPYCANQALMKGFNDLETLFPDIAVEADGWDPGEVLAGSGKSFPWKCIEAGHPWNAEVAKRTGVESRGCPSCASYGFDPGKPAWFYLMIRPGEQQFGITNNLEKRKRAHGRLGWTLLDSIGSTSGKEIQELELRFKRWLKRTLPLVPGKTENWFTVHMEVQSLLELKEISQIGKEFI